MTERPQDNLADDAIKTLLQHGLGQGLPRIAEMLLNAAMCFERSNHLNADPYERAQARTGHANGFKPRSLQTPSVNSIYHSLRSGPASIKRTEKRGYWLVVFEFKLSG